MFLSFQMKWQEKDSFNSDKIDDDLIKVPVNCAIVDSDNFNDFYNEIFSSCAQFFAAQVKVFINTVRYCELRAIHGVGEKIAATIIENREKIRENILMIKIYVDG
ncbi:hypothetical protein RclHR1_01090020 [Rhizophagus clarus]|uniref:Uncharacterized protein n=1 Tax=Rhizophagus clarus TaxID=94130 RepID=A0A2Z6QHL9_9GLOM|nr:hypothetical protein RclHR1_01090020 [Rhizophagus clarus]